MWHHLKHHTAPQQGTTQHIRGLLRQKSCYLFSAIPLFPLCVCVPMMCICVCVCFKLRLSTVLLGVYACACVPSECHAISLSHRWWWWDISGERNSITCWRRSALQNEDDGSLSSDPVRYTLFAQSLRMCHYRWLNILNQLVLLDRNDSLQYRSLFSPWVSDSQMIGHRRSSSNKNGGRCESSHHHPYAAGFLLAGRRDSSHLSRLWLVEMWDSWHLAGLWLVITCTPHTSCTTMIPQNKCKAV